MAHRLVIRLPCSQARTRCIVAVLVQEVGRKFEIVASAHYYMTFWDSMLAYENLAVPFACGSAEEGRDGNEYPMQGTR
jgi:hypothetical protein